MVEILHGTSDDALIGSIEENLIAFHLHLGQWPEINVHIEEDRIWTRSQRQFSLCNTVLNARFPTDDADNRIARALAPFESAHVNLMWKLGPATRPQDLATRLERFGLMRLPYLHGMVLDLSRLTSHATAPDIEVRSVTDVVSLQAWREAIARGFGWPSHGPEAIADNVAFVGCGPAAAISAYVAFREGQPAGSSLVFFGAGVAGLYHIATVPEARRRGVGAAATMAALREGRERGYRFAILHATEAGLPLYRRLGFREYCRIDLCRRLTPS